MASPSKTATKRVSVGFFQFVLIFSEDYELEDDFIDNSSPSGFDRESFGGFLKQLGLYKGATSVRTYMELGGEGKMLLPRLNLEVEQIGVKKIYMMTTMMIVWRLVLMIFVEKNQRRVLHSISITV